ncbi:hypothetical protein V7122_10760 [Bacillus sp. JJ1532]|uniref:hypothetical protein n=1 Tax=Bacillus sp. JJ1532 TaxID=3122958 RepID=UPI002FFE76C7
MESQDEKMKDFQLKWFDIIMEEYNTLRNESGDSLRHQQSIINYGLTAIGVLIAFSANLWGKDHIVESIYVFFIPFMCNLIILIWNGEVRRMSRAGLYIKRIEDKINKELSSKSNISIPALEWETYLRKPKESENIDQQQMNWLQKLLKWIGSIFSFLFHKNKEKNNKIKSNYIAIILMFGGLSLFSIILGFSHNFGMYGKETLLSSQALFPYWLSSEYLRISLYMGVFIIDFLFFIYHYRYFQKVKQ